MRVNFHIHSSFSYDGFNSFPAIYENAKRIGLDAIALTDHDCFDGVPAFITWLLENKISDLEIIPGEEVTCTDGTHIIGLFIKKLISPGTPSAVCQMIKDQGGFVYFPHPARHDGILASPEAERVITMGDFYELFNAKIDHSLNLAALEQLKSTQLAPLAGSDAHYNIDIRKCYCEFFGANNAWEALSEYQRDRRIAIFGKTKTGSSNYFSLYYKYKKWLPLPYFVKEVAKKMVPAYRNHKDRSKEIILENLYSTE